MRMSGVAARRSPMVKCSRLHLVAVCIACHCDVTHAAPAQANTSMLRGAAALPPPVGVALGQQCLMTPTSLVDTCVWGTTCTQGDAPFAAGPIGTCMPSGGQPPSPLDNYKAYALYNCYAGHGGEEMGYVGVTKSLVACAETCNQDDVCEGFVYMYSQGKCWLRGRMSLPQCEVGTWGQESSSFSTFTKKMVQQCAQEGQTCGRQSSDIVACCDGMHCQVDTGLQFGFGTCQVAAVHTPVPTPAPTPADTCGSCLCVFDIDRTLTGKQEQTRQCPRNRVVEPPVTDLGYGRGKATLSALAAEGINKTFCNQCYLGITSAGHGSGENSPWNAYILDHIMRGAKHDSFFDSHPEYKRWSHGTNVRSPYVLGQGNRLKQNAVELIRQWFAGPGRDICIRPSNVYFFGDRTENIEPFSLKGLNSREISCGSRDPDLYRGTGMVGFCGARPEEIKREQGNILCA